MKLFQNPNYVLSIIVRGREEGSNATWVQANLPEQLSVGVKANWEARLPMQSLSAFDIIGDVPTSVFNADALIAMFTWQSWHGSGPIEFNFQLNFAAEDDALEDVVKPTALLESLAMPREGFDGYLLLPPGPSLLTVNGSGISHNPDLGRISLAIGNFMYVPNVVITSCETTYEMKFDAKGQPIAAQTSIAFSTINTPSREEFIGYFRALNSRESGGGTGGIR